MTTFRNPDKDKRKSDAVYKEQYKLNKKCCMDGCNNPISIFEGPGSDVLCREDQLKLVEYGGYGRIERPHTFHRADVCCCCGQDINDDARWVKAQQHFGVLLTEEEKHEIKRRYNHGDHNGVRRADGGDNSAENIAPMCTFCHWVKTVINNDGRKGTLK